MTQSGAFYHQKTIAGTLNYSHQTFDFFFFLKKFTKYIWSHFDDFKIHHLLVSHFSFFKKKINMIKKTRQISGLHYER